MNKPAEPMVEIEKLQNAVETLENRLRETQVRITALQAVHEVAGSLTSELNLDPLLHKILASAVEVMDAAAGSLLLLDELTDELIFAVIEGGGGEQLKGVRMDRQKGIAGWVATNREPLIVNDVSRDDRYYRQIANSANFTPTSLLCVPMISHNRLTGVLQLMHATPGRYFSQLDQQLLTTFAHQAAIAIDNARLYENLKEERDHLVVVEDRIRKSLARDLHDGPIQLLASIVMSLGFTKILMEQGSDQVGNEIDRNLEYAEKAMKQLRSLLFDLRPVILETQGLIPALELYLEQLVEAEELEVRLVVEREFARLSPTAEVTIFAIIQEAVNNARKHAMVSEMELILQPRPDTLTVRIKDEGLGFDVHTVQAGYEERGSLGLLNMQERALLINGTLKINSQVGEGTEVILHLPLEENLLQAVEDAE